MSTLDIATDCRHYLGDRPCRFGRLCRCEHYAPMGTRILIIKLAALGDVVRTACLLPTLKRTYDPCHITWITRPSGARILSGHPQVDRLVAFDAEGILTVRQQPWDLVLSLDKEAPPTALCNAVACSDKRGIGMSPWGTACPLGEACAYYFRLGLDDDEKFHRNTKSYPELIHDALALPYRREPYRLSLDEEARRRAARMFAPWRGQADGALVGLNTGSGRVFANKAPRREAWVDLARALLERGHRPVLLGGPDERALNAWIAEQLGPAARLAGCDHSEQQFVAVVDQCDAVVTGDTLAMHVAIARDVPVVALFGPTCPQEIDLFDRGVKLVSDHPCSPCYRRECDMRPNCMDVIPTARIVEAVERVLAMGARGEGQE